MQRRATGTADGQSVSVQAEDIRLSGELVVPEEAHGIVVFAHGSGSSRHSPRNRYVARVLQDGGLATLLFDLLTPEEEALDMRSGHLRFDIGLLRDRIVAATDWLADHQQTCDLRAGYFGASTGAGGALVAAAERPDAIGAIVSRGGRPDLAGSALGRVMAPTLLIVGGQDPTVLELNQTAMTALSVEKELVIVPGATHLFEEPGALERVASLAREWFKRHIGAPTHA
jgi:putative phosphoribosyl transferase